MSGGVDSSVAAALLQEQGHEVEGLFMRNWEEKDENGVCQASLDILDAAEVCDKLNIKLHEVNFSKEYWDQVFQEFLNDYENGLTPNPDILCNREIKFKVMMDKVLELGGEALATGHYCQVEHNHDTSFLKKAYDQNKDQTYFLNAIKEDALKKTYFPLGDIDKSLVRKIAKEKDLITHNKKDSTGICFIGERNFSHFLKDYIYTNEGDFRLLSNEKVGTHNGLCFYTYGQRKGLGLGGQGEPWFVVDKDLKENIVYVERGEQHPALYSDELIADRISWINSVYEEKLAHGEHQLNCKIRYRQKDQACNLKINDGEAHINFSIPQRAISPGQSIAFYDGDICIGGAFIKTRGPSYHQMKRPLPEIVAI